MNKKTLSVLIIIFVVVVAGLIWVFGFNNSNKILCVSAGEAANNPSLGPNGFFGECCEGLKEIPAYYESEEVCVLGLGGANICSDCGNNICETWENKCNCPEDCKIEDECSSVEDCPLWEGLEAEECKDGICYFYG